MKPSSTEMPQSENDTMKLDTSSGVSASYPGDILFELMRTVSQVTEPDHAKRLFIDSINNCADHFKIRFNNKKPAADDEITVATDQHYFGHIEVLPLDGKRLNEVDLTLLQNGAELLAVTLEKLLHARIKNDEKLLLEVIVNTRTLELEHAHRKLKEANTERTSLKEELLDSRHLARRIAEITPNLIYIYNIKEQKNEFTNRKITDLLGYSLKEISNRRAEPAPHDIHPDDLERVLCRLKRLQHTSDDNAVEIIYRAGHADGSWLWLRSKVAPFTRDADGTVTKIIGIAEDISEQKHTEEARQKFLEQLRQAQKMEAVGTLATGIAHDFNNILAAIIGYAGLAKAELPPDCQASDDIEEVLAAGHRAKELVYQILAFSRKTHLERSTIQLDELIPETVKLIRATTPTSVDIQVEILAHDRTMLADRSQINQVLINLCTNGVQAMDENGVLHIKLEEKIPTEEDIPAHLAQDKNARFLCLSVSDNGCGIKETDLEKVFDPYFTTKGTDEGTGMGLAIVSGIVTNHGGFIKVTSEEGKGSTFSLFFPEVPPIAPHAVPDSPTPPTGTEHILLIDDEEGVLKMNQQRLERLGYEVTATKSSLKALELLFSQPDRFDLVLTDQTMPVLTGKQLAREISACQPSTPVIICTGYSSKIDAQKAADLGIAGFLMKPMPTMELAEKVREVLDREARSRA